MVPLCRHISASCGIAPAVEDRDGVFVLADGQQRGEVPEVLLEQVEHRGDPPLAEPDPWPHPLFLELVRPGVRRLLEQGEPGLVPQLPAEQERGVGGQRDLRRGYRLGGVPVVREGFGADLEVQLHARAGGLGRDAVAVGRELLGPIDRDPHVFAARREDLLVEHPVALVGRHEHAVHVLLAQRRQDAGHDQPAAGGPGPRVRRRSGRRGSPARGPPARRRPAAAAAR